MAHMADQYTEFNANNTHPVVGLITEWQDQSGDSRDAASDSAALCVWVRKIVC